MKTKNARKEGLALLRRLASESRKLAYQCAEGTAPPLKANDFGRAGYHCAMGLALARAGRASNPWPTFDKIAELTRGYRNAERDVSNLSASDILIRANNAAPPAQRHAAVVFPLLNFADACDRTLVRIAAGRSSPRPAGGE